LDIALVQELLPTAERLEKTDAELPVRAVWAKGELLGYIYLTDEVTPIPAYSGKPVSMLVALGLDARIVGTIILQHDEPILVIGVTDQDLQRFTNQYAGLDARSKVRIGAYHRPGYLGVDGITGATITAMVLNSSIMKSAQMIADELKLPRESGHVEAIPLAADPAATVSTAEEEPLWMEHWRAEKWALSLLSVALFLLMVVLFFQDWLVVHPRLFHRLRTAYLLFTLVYLGFICKAQLSVINLIAFMRVLFGGFTWETLLIDPVIFLLWGFVAVSIILWGRGVFCGWLCPFGAAQELIHKISERFALPTWEFPAMVHERLWAIKYFILIALVGLSLESMHYAARMVEIEPFKTVFVLRFDREALFVGYAVLLLAIALFNSKFYCKYLCPLGAALSFFTRFRIFDWLRRRKECGKPCQSCAAQCQIAAIKPTGEIIDNECHYCLECQVTYWDDQRCPPLVEKRKRREDRDRRAAGVLASDQPAA
jgi:Na+-translocating ferredoxin:NAD+ oxidoreductase RnfG subunit